MNPRDVPNMAISSAEGSDQENALPVFRGETYESYVQAWINVSEEIEERRWRLGAIAASLVWRYGENTAATFAADVGVSSRTVRDYARAYRVFETGTRVPILSYTHHRIAARSEDPQKAIEEAADKLLSTRQMEVRVEAEALPPEERRLVIRAAEERRFTGEETRRLVAARIEKARKQGAPKSSPSTPPGTPLAGASLAENDQDQGSSESSEQGRHLVSEANQGALSSGIDEDIEDIVEVCPYCGASSSAWERRPPDPERNNEGSAS